MRVSEWVNELGCMAMRAWGHGRADTTSIYPPMLLVDVDVCQTLQEGASGVGIAATYSAVHARVGIDNVRLSGKRMWLFAYGVGWLVGGLVGWLVGWSVCLHAKRHRHTAQ